MNAAVVIFEGVDELDVFGPFEVLCNAARAGVELDVRLVTLNRVDQVCGGHGANLRPHCTLGDFEADLVIVPGGGWNARAPNGAWAQAQQPELPEALRRCHDAGATIASVCTGAGILAAAGLLDGRPASTHHAARQDLSERGVQVVDARVVDDGEILSAGGVTAGIDVALWLVEREWGAELADRLAAGIEYERRGPIHHGPHSSRR